NNAVFVLAYFNYLTVFYYNLAPCSHTFLYVFYVVLGVIGYKVGKFNFYFISFYDWFCLQIRNIIKFYLSFVHGSCVEHIFWNVSQANINALFFKFLVNAWL